MRGWRCERCGFTHIDEAPYRPPKKCPACGSARVKVIMPVKAEELHGEVVGKAAEDPVREVYRMLSEIRGMSVQEQESARRRLREAGVHVLCLDERLGRLGDILTGREVESYLTLIREENFGFAVIDRVVVAVASDSPIREHVGVNPEKLRELLSAAGQP